MLLKWLLNAEYKAALMSYRIVFKFPLAENGRRFS